MATSMVPESEENPETKIAAPVDDIRPGIEGSICVCGEGKRHQICAIQNATEHVYIYENMTSKGVLHLPSQCQCMCVSRDPTGDEHLICGMQDGRIIHQNLQLFRDESETRPKKKKKDKHRSKEKPRRAVLLSKGSEDDIFGELLDAETKPSCSSAPPSDVDKDELLDNVIILGDSSVLLTEPNVQDLMSLRGCLITCAKCAAGYTLSVYCQEVRGQSQLGTASTSHHAPGGKGLEYAKSPSFRAFLPENGMESSTHFGNRSVNQSGDSQHLGHSRDTEAEGSYKSEKPQLFCVVSQSMSGKEDPKTYNRTKTVILEDSLYNQLFGTDFNFLDTPIILICLPDGRVYHTPVRTQANKSKPARTESNLSGLNTSLFYVLDQPVATIHGFNTGEFKPAQATENLNHHCDCVCIVGRYGRMVQITENETTNQRERLKFTESHIKGPVQTTCKTRTPQTLLYSTSEEIYSVSFSKASGKGVASTVKGSSVSCSFILGIGNIRALALVGRASKDSKWPLVALTASGKVLRLHPPTDGSHGNRSPPITAVAAGKRMQALLRAINNISTRSSELAKLGETQDQILKEMSQACHLASSLLSDHNSATNATIFSVEVQSVQRNDGAQCNLELLCKLTNHSPWTLSHGWSLLVSVNADPDWTKLDKDMRYHVTKSVLLVNFRPIQTVEVIFPLHCGKTSLALPVYVQCFLHFSPEECMQPLLPEKTDLDSKSHIELVESGILLPLIQPKVLDLVTVLRPIQDYQTAVQGTRLTSQYQTTLNSGCDWLALALQSAASSRPSANGMGCSIPERTSEGLVSVCVKFSSDITTLILEHGEHECCLPEQILNFLFEDNKSVSQSTNPLRLLTPDAKVVTFQVNVQPNQTTSTKEQKAKNARGGIAETSKGQSNDNGKESGAMGEAVEVVITAPDYPTLCQLQLAVDGRLKMVLGGTGKSRGINTSQDRLQRELGKVQVLQSKLRSLQDVMMQHPSSNHCNIDSTATLELYQQMRSQLTLM